MISLKGMENSYKPGNLELKKWDALPPYSCPETFIYATGTLQETPRYFNES